MHIFSPHFSSGIFKTLNFNQLPRYKYREIKEASLLAVKAHCRD